MNTSHLEPPKDNEQSNNEINKELHPEIPLEKEQGSKLKRIIPAEADLESIIEYDEEQPDTGAVAESFNSDDCVPHGVTLQKEIMSIVLAMPGMMKALSLNQGPCAICHGDDHPTLRCGLLWKDDLSPPMYRRLEQFKMQLENDQQSMDGSSLDSDDQREKIIRKKLSKRAYHLPGNSWWQDYVMYMINTHIILGLFYSHELHPVRFKQRLVLLLGSLAFGLTVTNTAYLFYFLGLAEHIEKEVKYVDQLVWTVGSLSHSFFDYALWNMVACQCIKNKWFRATGWNVVVIVVSLLVAGTSIAVTLRAYKDFLGIEVVPTEDGSGETTIIIGNGGEADINFLWTFLIELVIALFVFTPITQTIFFSGVLGCGKVPFLGGRPYEMRSESSGDDEDEDKYDGSEIEDGDESGEDKSSV